MRRVVISDNDANQRLDRFLLKFLDGPSFSLVCKWLRKGNIRINGQRSTGQFHLGPGDVVTFNIAERFFPTRKRETYNHESPGLPPILYEDSSMLVLDKPAGLAVHPGSGIGGTHLVAAVLKYLDSGTRDEQIPGPVHRSLTFRPSPVHRLDKSTSGIIVFSKTAAAHRAMAEDLRWRRWRKTYYGVIYGEIEPSAGSIDCPLARKEGPGNKVDRAITTYRTLQTKNGMSLLELVPETGRFRQIRRHLAEVGFPLVGDRRFNNWQTGNRVNRYPRSIEGRLLLHAGKLVLPHPESRNELSIVSDIPFGVSEG